MTPVEIAEDMGNLDLAAVKAMLMNCSSKYRKDCGQEPDEEEALNFSKDDLKYVNRVIMDTIKSTEDDHLRTKLAMYVRDDKKGRRDNIRMGKELGNGGNVMFINQLLMNARSGADALKNGLGQGSRKAIEA